MGEKFDVAGLRTEYHSAVFDISKDDVKIEETAEGVVLSYGVTFTDENGDMDVGAVEVEMNEEEETVEIRLPGE